MLAKGARGGDVKKEKEKPQFDADRQRAAAGAGHAGHYDPTACAACWEQATLCMDHCKNKCVSSSAGARVHDTHTDNIVVHCKR